jgi:hypothetical protein
VKRARVEIGTIVVHGPRSAAGEGAALRRQIEANLGQLLLRGGVASESRTAKIVQIKGGTYHSGSNVAGDIARALHKSIQGRT